MRSLDKTATHCFLRSLFPASAHDPQYDVLNSPHSIRLRSTCVYFSIGGKEWC